MHLLVSIYGHRLFVAAKALEQEEMRCSSEGAKGPGEAGRWMGDLPAVHGLSELGGLRHGRCPSHNEAYHRSCDVGQQARDWRR